ncbi:MAG: hypothetical protein HYU83_01135 [Chloroflexi bacterium]|nr:hypothetical protein [Chloroflexota bacterium]
MKPWKGGGQVHMDWLAKREAMKIGCHNCHQKCIRSPHLPDGHPVFLKCRAPFRFVNAADIRDYDFNMHCISFAQRCGLDVLSAAALCAFAVDLYQRGILTKEDTGGMQLEWGNPAVFPALLEKIVRREGIGDILANGVYEAARQIGRGAEQYAYHMRKLEPRGYSIRGLPHAWLLSDRQDSTSWVNASRGALRPSGRVSHGAESGDWYAESVYWAYPQDWKEYRKRRLDVTEVDYEMESKVTAYDAFSTFLSDCNGFCRFWSAFKIYSPIRDWDQIKLVLYATGLDMDEKEVRKCARRARALIRAYNAILGERTKVDDLPNVIGFETVDHDKLSKVMEEANKEMGCNAEGFPTREALEELGLDYIAEELERREILPRPVSIAAV